MTLKHYGQNRTGNPERVPELLMFTSIHKFLLSNLENASNNSFPELEPKKINIVLCIPPFNSLGDISSTLAFQISRLIGKSFNEVALTIASNFFWDDRFVIPCRDGRSAVNNGFINFNLSSIYLHDVFSAILLQTIPQSIPFIKNKETTKALLESTAILKLAEKSLQSDNVNYCRFNIEELKTNEEILLIKWLGVAPLFSDSRSFRSSDFFQKQISEAFLAFYKKHPIFVSETELTTARVQLTRAVHHALLILCTG